jgi:hypothetical protein
VQVLAGQPEEIAVLFESASPGAGRVTNPSKLRGSGRRISSFGYQYEELN